MSTATTPARNSKAASLASLPEAKRRAFLKGLSRRATTELLHAWYFWGRAEQLPPPGAWRVWCVQAGRGWGKTRTGAEFVRSRVESGKARRVALVGPTAADVRDVMVEGESGILAVCPPWNMPRYEPSKRRLTWRNGAVALAFSAEEPERLRGPQSDLAWCDEIGSWRRGVRTWDNLMLGMRLGNPRTVATFTPRRTKLVRRLVDAPGTVVTGGSSFDNRPNLAESFFDEVIATYEGTRLGNQEIHAELLEVSEGAWFPTFSTRRHVTPDAEYDPALPVHLAVDCGVSRCTGSVLFQVLRAGAHRVRASVFADYYAEDLHSEANALAIHRLAAERCAGRIDRVRLDPASSARTGTGPVARGEYERVFGARLVGSWPMLPVADGLDLIEIVLGGDSRPPELLIHPRCTALIDAFQNYSRAVSPSGELLNRPEDPCHPYEDLMDAIRGGLVDVFPDGRRPEPALRRVPARLMF